MFKTLTGLCLHIRSHDLGRKAKVGLGLGWLGSAQWSARGHELARSLTFEFQLLCPSHEDPSRGLVYWPAKDSCFVAWCLYPGTPRWRLLLET